RGRFAGIENVEQVMRDLLPLAKGWLGRADVKSAIELRGIAGDNFAAELLRQQNDKRARTRGGGSDDHCERRKRRHRNRICQARATKITRDNPSRRMLPRTCWRVGFIKRTGYWFAASMGRLYRKMKRRRISGPLK